MTQLLGFVSSAQYGDHIDPDRPCDVPEEFTCASTAPRGGALHLSSVLPAVTDAIGMPITTAVHANPHAVREALGIPQARSAIVVLVDGLGYWNLAMRVAHAPYLRSLMKESGNQRPISTCSPSTTSAAMATFGTGTCPGLTCMTGYTQRNPHTGQLSQLISFRNAMSPEELQQQPTIFESLHERGVRVTNVGLSRFKHSPLTRAAFRGADYIGDDQPLSRVTRAAHSAQEPGITYLYIRDIDKTGHAEGWDSEQWIASFERVDNQLATLRRLAPRDTLIVIVADHGMVSSDPQYRIDIAQESALREGVAMTGGEPRNVMVYVDDHADVDAVAQRWRERLHGLAWVRTQQEAIDAGVFGPVTPEALGMLGDIIVESASQVTLVNSATQKDGATRLPSVHGSQTMLEMDIPCLIDIVE